MYNEVIDKDPALRIENLGYIVIRANIPAHAISPDLPITMRAFVYEFAIELPQQDLIPAALGTNTSTATTTDSTTGNNPDDVTPSPSTPVAPRKALSDADISSMTKRRALKPTALFAPATPSQPSKLPKMDRLLQTTKTNKGGTTYIGRLDLLDFQEVFDSIFPSDSILRVPLRVNTTNKEISISRDDGEVDVRKLGEILKFELFIHHVKIHYYIGTNKRLDSE
eukprot:scaffold270425_cov64-Attheya_sp.AAC.2